MNLTKEERLQISAWLADKEDPSLLKESGIKKITRYLLEEASDILSNILEKEAVQE